MKFSLCDIVKEICFELVRRNMINPREEVKWLFRPIYLNIASALKNDKNMQKYRIDNIYNKLINDFCVDFFKEQELAKYMVIRYYNKSGKYGFEVHRFGSKRKAMAYIDSLDEPDKVIVFYNGVLVDTDFKRMEYRYNKKLEELFAEQIFFSEDEWRKLVLN